MSNLCLNQIKKNFPFKLNNNRAKEPFDLIHMITVSINDESLYGNRYFSFYFR